MDRAPCFAGLDIGTSRIKAVLVDGSGRVIAAATRPTPWTDGGRELVADQLLAAALDGVDAVLDAGPGYRPDALGITSIAETGFLCAPDGTPLTSGIAWHDPRGQGATARLASDVGALAFAATTGLRLSATPSIAKIHWLLANGSVPGGSIWLGVAEWLAVAVGASPRAELSLASRTGLLHVARRAPSCDLGDWLGLPGLLPPLVASGEAIGTVSPRFERLSGASVVLAGHDHLCAAVGVGATERTDLLNSCGTGEAFIASTVEPMSSDRIADAVAHGLDVGWHVLPGRQSLISSLATGAALARVLDLLGLPRDFAALERRSDLRGHPGTNVRIDGLFDEVLDVQVTGSDVDAVDVWLAAVAVAHQASVAAYGRMRDWTGGFGRIVGTGGWLNSRHITDLKARDLERFTVAPVAEGAARGAALLAGVGAGWWADAASVPQPESLAR